MSDELTQRVADLEKQVETLTVIAACLGIAVYVILRHAVFQDEAKA